MKQMKMRILRTKLYRYGALLLLSGIFTMMIACEPKDRSESDEKEITSTVSKEDTLESDKDEVRSEEDKETEVSEAPEDSEKIDPVQAEKELPKEEADSEKATTLKKYKSILEDVYYKHIFPDGQACDWNEGTDLSQNMYSIYDIDHDNKEELILVYSTASMAGMVEIIYGYHEDTKTTSEELRIFPNATHYDNGIIKAGWSHNQGMAGEFWPYTLYQYDQQSDQYVSVGMVDAWDRTVSETNYDNEEFPSDCDADEDGIVYYIMQDGNYELKDPADGPEYQEWITSYIESAKELEIPFSSMTEDNITKIDIED